MKYTSNNDYKFLELYYIAFTNIILFKQNLNLLIKRKTKELDLFMSMLQNKDI